MKKTLEPYEENWNFEEAFCNDINNKNFPIPFFSIIALFAEDANYGLKDCYVHGNRLFIRGRTKGRTNELMLRYHGQTELVVARIQFVHRRKGNMTELYRILKRIQKKYHTGPIAIESVTTEEMEAWCIKNKFQKVGRNYIQPGKYND